MKKILLVFCFLPIALLSFSQNTKKEKPYYPSVSIGQAFRTEFGDKTEVVWSFINAELVKATFKMEGAPAFAYYNPEGQLVYLFQDAAMNDLPRKSLEKIGGILANFKIQEIKQTWTDDDHCFYLLGANGDKKRVIRVCMKGNVAIYKDYQSKDNASSVLVKEVAGLQ